MPKNSPKQGDELKGINQYECLMGLVKSRGVTTIIDAEPYYHILLYDHIGNRIEPKQRLIIHMDIWKFFDEKEFLKNKRQETLYNLLK